MTKSALDFSVTLPRGLFLSALKRAQRLAVEKAERPVLSHVHLHAVAGSLRVTATNLRISWVEDIEAQTETAGEVLLPASALAGVLRVAGAGDITLRSTDGWATLTVPGATWMLPTLPVDSWPEVPILGGARLILPAQELLGLVEATRYAVHPDSVTRATLCGLYLHRSAGGFLSAVATDGHRLALAHSGVEVPEGWGGIVPAAALPFVAELCHRDSVHLSIVGGTLHVADGEARLAARLLDDTYPDYLHVLPRELDPLPRLQCDADALYAAVRRCAVFTDDETHAVQLSAREVEVEGRRELRLLLTSDTGQGHSACAEAPLQEVANGNLPPLVLDARYLGQALQQCEGTVVRLSAEGALSPVVLHEAEGGNLHVIMPQLPD